MTGVGCVEVGFLDWHVSMVGYVFCLVKCGEGRFRRLGVWLVGGRNVGRCKHVGMVNIINGCISPSTE